MISMRDRRIVSPLAIAALGGALVGFGILGIFALYGIVPLALGVFLVGFGIQRLGKARWFQPLVASAVAATLMVGILVWGAEHIWASPSCSQHQNQVSGRITFWSGASVSWDCINGQPIVTHDSR
jgi:hypothetical protein